MRISDWSSDVCSSDLAVGVVKAVERHRAGDVDAGREAEAQPLLVEQAANDVQPFGVGDAELRIDRRALQIGRDAVLPDALGDARSFGFQFAALIIVIDRKSTRLNSSH